MKQGHSTLFVKSGVDNQTLNMLSKLFSLMQQIHFPVICAKQLFDPRINNLM